MAHRPLHAASLGVGGIARRSTTAPGLLAWLAGNLAERERWFLWLPVGLGTGVAMYFALPIEPGLARRGRSARCWCSSVLAVVAPARRGVFGCVPGLLGVLALLLGFAVASVRTQLVEAPVRCLRIAVRTSSRPPSCSWRIAPAANAFCSATRLSRGWSATPLRPRSA